MQYDASTWSCSGSLKLPFVFVSTRIPCCPRLCLSSSRLTPWASNSHQHLSSVFIPGDEPVHMSLLPFFRHWLVLQTSSPALGFCRAGLSSPFLFGV